MTMDFRHRPIACTATLFLCIATMHASAPGPIDPAIHKQLSSKSAQISHKKPSPESAESREVPEPDASLMVLRALPELIRQRTELMEREKKAKREFDLKHIQNLPEGWLPQKEHERTLIAFGEMKRSRVLNLHQLLEQPGFLSQQDVQEVWEFLNALD